MKIICEHISKSFPSPQGRLNVLEDINIGVEEHDFVCILGANGCGKTTLLKIMAKILKPTKGNIQYIGKNGSLVKAFLIYQGQGLFPWLNVMDNACFGLEMHGWSKKERYEKARSIIEQMGLSRFVEFYPHQLSVGMNQKINLIRGLLMDSSVLLIDEPDTSLDPMSKVFIRNDICRIWKEYDKTIIYVTHDIDEALQLAKHIWVMGKYPGKIISKFDVDSQYSSVSNRRVATIQTLNLRNQIIDIIEKEHKYA